MIINDISYWQGEVNFAKFKTASAGVYLRAGFGANSTAVQCRDTRFIQYYSGMQAAGVPTGAYWFADYRKTPEQQAGFFAQAVEGRWGQFYPVLDFEFFEGFGKTLPAGANCLAWIKRFLEACDNASGKTTMLYCNPSMLNHIKPLFGGYPDWLKARPLWIANYTTAQSPQTYGLEWRLWQYSDKGQGAHFGVGSASIDMNRLRVADLATIGYVAPPPENPCKELIAENEALKAEREQLTAEKATLTADKARLLAENEELEAENVKMFDDLTAIHEITGKWL
jgi:GH25 family lysozyme M1 (1,4-beta-N-acetylmuramidase)